MNMETAPNASALGAVFKGYNAVKGLLIMRMPRLTEKEIGERLARVPEWARAGDAIGRTYSFGSFRAAMAFIARAGEAAERADHHPDMDIRYRKVTLLLTTHDSGGLTTNDFDLAAVCDALAEEPK